jgi:hypothetical protein
MIYLFCFAEPDAPVDALEGVFAERFHSCAAVVSEAAPEEFTAEHLEDVAWVAPRACRHEEVVETITRSSPVLPARFGALFSSSQALSRFAAVHGPAIAEFLAKVKTREEWSVKVFAAPRPAAAAEDSAGLSPGALYLRQKSLLRKADAPDAAIEAAAAAMRDDLERLAFATADRKRIAEPGQRLLANWAFLLDKPRVDAFRERAAASAAGITARISGPWPPYSFVPELPVPEEE